MHSAVWGSVVEWSRHLDGTQEEPVRFRSEPLSRIGGKGLEAITVSPFALYDLHGVMSRPLQAECMTQGMGEGRSHDDDRPRNSETT
jgi:hypothetical protein